MSIKDELQHVKDELSGDEKILESAFKLERLYKKYKTLIWGALIIVLVGVGSNIAWGAYQQSKLDTANQAFLSLQQNPDNSDAVTILKSNNPELYALYRLSQAIKSQKGEALKAFENNGDPLIADMARYHAGVLEGKPVDSVYYHDLTVVEEAYADLKAGKKAAAKSKLTLIAEDSPVAKIAQLLKHYTLNLK